MFLWIQRVFFGKVWQWEDEELGEPVAEEREGKRISFYKSGEVIFE